MSRMLVALALLILAIAVVLAALIISGSDIEVPVLSDLIATSTTEAGTDGSEADLDPTAVVVVEPISTSTPESDIPATVVTQSTQVPTPDSTTSPQQSEPVAFTSEPVQITNIETGAFDPSWNPTGENIAFLQWKSEGPCANRCADIGVVEPDGSNQGVLATGPGPAGDIGIGGHIAWVGDANLLLTNERNVFHEYMAIDATQAPFTRTAFDGDDAAFTKVL